MPKAVVPMARFHEKFGPLDGPAISGRIADMAEQFLHEAAAKPKELMSR
jgi:hypothetical protein